MCHNRKHEQQNYKVMFGNTFCFLFLKTCFGEYKKKKKKKIFLYFWNQKHVCLVEIKKNIFLKNKNTKILKYVIADLNSNANSLNETNSLN